MKKNFLLLVLSVFTISLFAQSLNILLARAFFALHNTITPLKAGIVGVVLNAGLGLLIIKYWSVLSPFWEQQGRFSGMKAPIVGLAFSYSLSQIAIFFILFVNFLRNSH